MLPVALASLPTITVEQAEALKAMEPTAAPMASTESLYLKFIGFLLNGKNMICGGDLALHHLKAGSAKRITLCTFLN